MQSALELGRKGWKRYLKSGNHRIPKAQLSPSESKHRKNLLIRIQKAADVIKSRFKIRRIVLFGNNVLSLDEFRRFRHLVRNVYAKNLVPEIFTPFNFVNNKSEVNNKERAIPLGQSLFHWGRPAERLPCLMRRHSVAVRVSPRVSAVNKKKVLHPFTIN